MQAKNPSTIGNITTRNFPQMCYDGKDVVITCPQNVSDLDNCMICEDARDEFNCQLFLAYPTILLMFRYEPGFVKKIIESNDYR
jgi:hypothetical protein